MSRRYWAGVMLFSLLVAGGSGWMVFTTLRNKTSTPAPVHRTVPLQEISKPTPTATPSTAESAAEKPAETPSEDTDTGSSIETDGKRRVLFKLKSAGRQVFIIGDFNNWFRQPMKKDGNIFSVTIPIKPGTYEYKYVIDNKRVKDPNNKNTSKKGNSVLTVKPAS